MATASSIELSILYRGPLSSCNYDCHYCPFAKQHDTAEELRHDRACLDRFVGWLDDRGQDRLSIFFTPWGEALTRRWYQDAFQTLSRLPQIEKVVAQTNLSWSTDWLTGCDLDSVALWCTWHPSQCSLEDFLRQCDRLLKLRVRFSVGTVAMRDDLGAIESLRSVLPGEVYLWVNAAKSSEAPYRDDEVSRMTRVDPLFPINQRYHESFGKACRTGEDVVSVDGDGTVRRCHFVAEPLGNLYRDEITELLRPRPCPNMTCGCHIGYVHLEPLGLRETFAGGVLERIPDSMTAARG